MDSNTRSAFDNDICSSCIRSFVLLFRMFMCIAMPKHFSLIIDFFIRLFFFHLFRLRFFLLLVFFMLCASFISRYLHFYTFYCIYLSAFFSADNCLLFVIYKCVFFPLVVFFSCVSVLRTHFSDKLEYSLIAFGS